MCIGLFFSIGATAKKCATPERELKKFDSRHFYTTLSGLPAQLPLPDIKAEKLHFAWEGW